MTAEGAVCLDAAFAAVGERWRPKIVAELNGQEVKVVRVLGTFPWHRHETEDELFLVWRGCLRLEFRDRTVALGAGDVFVVPRGVEHRPVVDEEAQILLFEPAGVRNTGSIFDEVFTAPIGANA